MSGVSRATVSRVINGGSVSDKTGAGSSTALEETGYRPNLAARTLASGRSGVVGVVMHVDPHLLFRDAYFGQLLQGMSDELADLAAGMMLWLGNRTKEETLDKILSTGLADGVIVTAHFLDDPLVDGLLASHLPTVLVGHRRHDRSASYVDVDNVHAADSITTHLIQIGRTRVGHITGTRGTVAAEDRIVGYRRAMERAGLSVDGLIVEGDFNAPIGRHRRRDAARPSVRRDLLRQRLDRPGRPRDDPGSRPGGTRGRSTRRVRRPRLRSPHGPTPHHHPPERPRAGRRGGPHVVPADRGSRRRTTPRDPADGAGHPSVDRGRCAAALIDPELVHHGGSHVPRS